MDKNKKALFGITAAVALLCMVVALLVNRGGQNEKDKSIIKIGAILPLTGQSAYLGEDARNALLLAQEKINAGEGNQKITIVFGDSAGLAKDGVAAWHKMQLENIKYLITDTTQVSEGVNEICKDKIDLQVAMCAHPVITFQTDNLIRCFYGLEQEVEVVLPFFVKHGIKKIAFLYLDNPATKYVIEKVFIPKLEESNIEICAVETCKASDTSFRDSLIKVNSSSPEFIFTMYYGNLYSIILREAEQLGIRKKIMGSVLFATAPNIPLELKTDILFVAPMYLLGENKAYTEFVKEYESRYMTDMTSTGVFAYETAWLLSEHLKNGIVTKSQIVNSSFEGIIGKIQFDDTGRAIVEMTMATFDQDGKIKKYEDIEYLRP